MNPSLIKRNGEDLIIEKDDGWVELKDGDQVHILIDESCFVIKKLANIKKNDDNNHNNNQHRKRKKQSEEEDQEDEEEEKKMKDESDKKDKNQKKRRVKKQDSEEEEEDSNSVSSNNNKTKKKRMCRYGKDCYRNNLEHLKEYDHPPGHFSKKGTNNKKEDGMKKKGNLNF